LGGGPYEVSPTLAQDVSSDAADAYRMRRAPRPRPASIQTNLGVASKTVATFRTPPELAYQSFNELVLETGTFKNANGVGTGLPSAFEVLCYNGQPVGPTIRVRRGATFHIRLKNNLPKVAETPGHATGTSSEQPHGFCTTNMHTHGLHVSPAGMADNVFVDVNPQQEFTFEYTIPADHPSGTFWYHPHRHGSVAYQLSNGLAGALIVEGTATDEFPDLEDIPEIRAASERILVLQLYDFRVDPPGVEGVGRIDAKIIYKDVPPESRSCPAIPVPDHDPGEQGEVTAINGVIDPVIQLRPGEVQRWRLIHAAWDVNRRLSLNDSTLNPAADMHFHEIAVDGLATGLLAAKGNDPNDTSITLVEIAPGQRSDVLVHAPLLDVGETERTYYLVQSGRELGPGVAPVAEDKILAKIVVSGEALQMRLPDPQALVKCKPFADIQPGELATSDRSEIALNGLKFVATTGTNKRFWINGKTFSQYKTPVQIRVGTAEEWRVSAVAQNHPFHLHVNPFQVLMRIDAKGSSTPMNVWRDTLFLREGETYVIRSRFTDFLGKAVIHCHFLDHEDQGMMMPIEFIPPYQKPQATQFAHARRLDPMAIQAPRFKLTDVRGVHHELAEFRGRNLVLVFLLGIECSHCREQLAAIVRESRQGMAPDTEIVAVSSRPVDSAIALPMELRPTADRKVTLLVDEKQEVFRSFKCYMNGPQHGLYVIDGEGVVRAGYSGATPFDNAREVARTVRSLSPTE
jgi:FtsP/CotA-like multicopper oxidase with cupredoxin domain/peroxiredoxin